MNDDFQLDPAVDRDLQFDHTVSAEERAELTRLEGHLRRERPAPEPSFRSELRSRLLATEHTGSAPLGWRRLAAAYATAGLLCLLAAAAGLAGIGPFAT